MYWGCHSEPLTTSLEPSLVCHYFHLVVTESIWCALGNKKGIIYTKGKVTQNWKFVIIYSPSRNLFWVQEAAAIVKGIVETLINVVWQEVPLNAILHQRMAPEPDFRNWVLWRPSRDRLSVQKQTPVLSSPLPQKLKCEEDTFWLWEKLMKNTCFGKRTQLRQIKEYCNRNVALWHLK